MTSCATTALSCNEARNVVSSFPTIVRNHYHDGGAPYRIDRRESQQHVVQGSSFSNGAGDHNVVIQGMTIQPTNISTIMMTSSPSDHHVGSSSWPPQTKEDDSAALFQNKVRMAITPKIQLLDIITEVLDLIGDEEDHLFLDDAAFACS